MIPETVNEIICHLAEKLWPIKINLEEGLTVDKLKNKIYNEYMIPRSSQKWIVGRIFDDLDEIKLSKNYADKNSIFLIVSSSPPVVEICGDKIIEEEKEESSNVALVEQVDIADVVDNDKSSLAINIIDVIQTEKEKDQEENTNCKKVVEICGDKTIEEEKEESSSVILVEQIDTANVVDVIKIEKKENINCKEVELSHSDYQSNEDENKLFNLNVQLSEEEPNIESSVVLIIDHQNLKQNELIDDENKKDIISCNLTSKKQENEPRNISLPVVKIEQQDLEEDEIIPNDSASHHDVVIDNKQEPLVLKIKKQDPEVVEDKKPIVLKLKQQDLDNYFHQKDDTTVEEKKSLVFNLKDQDLDQGDNEIIFNKKSININDEKMQDDNTSLTSNESLNNDNLQFPLFIPNKIETNENFDKKPLPLVISDSSYIEPQYKKKQKSFYNKSYGSRVSSATEPLFPTLHAPIKPFRSIQEVDGAVGYTNYIQDFESSDDEKEDHSLYNYRAEKHQAWQNKRFQDDKKIINNQCYTMLDQKEETELQMALQLSKHMDVKINIFNNKNNNQIPVKKNKNNESCSLIELMMLEDVDLIQNYDDFQCPICLEIFGKYEGVILRDCHHTFCRDCLRNTIKHCEEPEVKCPYTEDYTCQSFLRQLEIKSLIDACTFENHILKSLVFAEKTASKNTNEKSFHCLSLDCPGWCYYSGIELRFDCYVCNRRNCLVCRVIHPRGETCDDYFDNLPNSQTLKLTEAQRLSMINKREIMECSNCKVAIVKNEGCDGIICTMCKTMLCWPTRGPRWGPKGKGDTSGGCRCGVIPGKTCHPECRGCH